MKEYTVLEIICFICLAIPGFTIAAMWLWAWLPGILAFLAGSVLISICGGE
jgi:hypothetical protein